MSVNLKGRSLLTLLDYSGEEIRYLLGLAKELKAESRRGEVRQRFTGKTLALLFEKRSTRTRCAFETAFGEEGGHPVFLSTQDIQLGAKVLGRMFSAIQFRGFRQSTAETLAEYSGVPVYNGLTDSFHPTQALADIMTLEENFGPVQGKKLCFIGDGRNNVARSLLVICAKLGVHCSIAAPPALWADPALVESGPFKLPPLPDGFVYTGLGVAGKAVLAPWEERQEGSIGAAGFMALDMIPLSR